MIENNKTIAGIRLKYIPNYLDCDRAKKLIEKIDRQSWSNDLKRRVQHYGYQYRDREIIRKRKISVTFRQVRID